MCTTSHTQETILRTCSYHRSRYYFPLLTTNPSKAPDTLFECLLTTSSLARADSNNPGAICKLPPEIISRISMLLDVKSFHSFRNANCQTRTMLTAIPQYRQVVQYGAEGIKALARTGLSDDITYKDLHNALINGECAMCGEFGGLLFLPTCTRCCYSCLREKPELAVVGGDDVYQLGILGAKMFSTSGCRYLKIQNWAQPTMMLDKTIGIPAVDICQAIRFLGSIQGNFGTALHRGWLHYRSAACIMYPTLDRYTMTVERGVSCKGCEKAFVTNRFEANGQGWTIPDIPSSYVDRDISFSTIGFLKHFEFCEHAQKIWENSEYGSKDTKDSKTIQNGGRHLGRTGMSAYMHWHRDRSSALLEIISSWICFGVQMESDEDEIMT
ncbi:hypothetical protein FPOAC2_05282 [Fusarium poae]|uniref:F-box domain-containing protein n=1 Tax=Fusarium poae TaxID=36050 RepID=A0A1B8AUT4_FUSPO|nr:hypothetical protein FPOA_04688 [Fusarium poae]